MAFAYRNINTDQIVTDDLPRPDLESLARWVSIDIADLVEQEPPEPTEPETPVVETGADLVHTTETPLDVVETTPSNDVTIVDAGEPAGDVSAPPADEETQKPDEPVSEPPAPAEPVSEDASDLPNGKWSHERLDAFAAKHDITLGTYKNRADKAAAINAAVTEGAAE